MEEMLRTKFIALFITSKCTLNCKHCSLQISKYEKRTNTPKEVVFKEIEKLFELYEFIEHIDLYGGEALLHPDLVEIILELNKYKDKFGFMRILTNCTIMPSDKLIETIKGLDCYFDFFLDHYGDNSTKTKDIQELLTKNNIPFKTCIYDENEQYFDGWVDFGDLSCRNYTEDKLQEVYDACHLAHSICLISNNGKLFHCAIALSGTNLNKFKLKDGEFIDLFDDSKSLKEKREIAKSFGTKPIEACKYCNGFDKDKAPRFPAAEQL